MKGIKRLAAIAIPSVRLYITSFSLSALSSLLASTQGSVSSMYLLSLLSSVNTSEIASETLCSSILAATLSLAAVATALRSASTSSDTPVLVTTPPKYLLLIEIVLFTRLPRILARSELNLSTTKSQVIVPSFS